MPVAGSSVKTCPLLQPITSCWSETDQSMSMQVFGGIGRVSVPVAALVFGSTTVTVAFPLFKT